ncbi:MAG: SHOCT domain-containing protein [Fidelibacterota bacterium]
MMGLHGFGGGWMMIFWWTIIIAAIVGIINLVRRNPSGEQVDTALEILKKRYARGEIETDEFERRKKELLNA